MGADRVRGASKSPCAQPRIAMLFHSFRLWLLAAVLSVTGPGCTTLRAPYREDPLLLSRKPVMGKPEEAKPHQLAFAEPSLPSLPAYAYVYPPREWKALTGDSALAENRGKESGAPKNSESTPPAKV